MFDIGLVVDALQLMVLGMGTVFAFLYALVLMISATSRVVAWVATPGATAGARPVGTETPMPVAPEPPRIQEQELVAVIAAALEQYRGR